MAVWKKYRPSGLWVSEISKDDIYHTMECDLLPFYTKPLSGMPGGSTTGRQAFRKNGEMTNNPYTNNLKS